MPLKICPGDILRTSKNRDFPCRRLNSPIALLLVMRYGPLESRWHCMGKERVGASWGGRVPTATVLRVGEGNTEDGCKPRAVVCSGGGLVSGEMVLRASDTQCSMYYDRV